MRKFSNKSKKEKKMRFVVKQKEIVVIINAERIVKKSRVGIRISAAIIIRD